MSAHHSDSGVPMPDEVESVPKIGFHKFETHTRQVSIRNTGCNTLWISFDQKKWHDVACGTSWDDRVRVGGFYHMTQTSSTFFVVVGLKLNAIPGEG